MVKRTRSVANYLSAAGLSAVLGSMLVMVGGLGREAVDDAKLPRFTRLEAFNPHRPNFDCKREADVNPPVSPEAEELFQQALALDSYEIWFEQRDYKKIALMYEQAMHLGHWKAQFNLAGLYLKGLGLPQDPEKAILLTEDLMKKGVPAAWDNMGTYYMAGVGSLKQSATVAYAFWQRAADIGSMASQTYIGAKLLSGEDRPPSVWANRVIGRRMLECAVAQGSGRAAFELGVDLSGPGGDDPRAFRLLHEGTKMGSEQSANTLSVSFRGGNSLIKREIDTARAERYSILGDALYTNPDLRFPNLDKVLPLPPAPLPKWDGDKQTLIDAAKAVVPVPPVPPPSAPSPASQRTGRAHIPEGYVLPERPAFEVPAQYETTSAPVAGYWLAQLLHPSSERHTQWDAQQWPMHYARDELFDRTRPGLLNTDGRIRFHYLGEPVPRVVQAGPGNPRVAQGVAREVDLPEPALLCRGDRPCPAAGVWHARVREEHPFAAVFNRWDRQAYVTKGQPFPDPLEVHLAIRAAQVIWQWWDQANEDRGGDVTYVTA